MEIVWNDDSGNPSGEGTGRGYSQYFPVQSFQAGVPLRPGRMVPDVAANADPHTGYKIVVHCVQIVTGGTSAVAPLYAGLFATLGTKLGFVMPKLWTNHLCLMDIQRRRALHDHIHHNTSSLRGAETVARQEPPKQASLKSVLEGNSPGVRGRLPRQASHGLTGTIGSAAFGGQRPDHRPFSPAAGRRTGEGS